MSLNLVPAGKSLPDDIYVIIEIPQNADPIKYEVDKDSGAIFVDRFMSTPMFYPCNYGYVNATLSLDGDPVDVLVPTPYPLPTSLFVQTIADLASQLPQADRATVGLPGMIRHGVVVTTPHYVTKSGPRSRVLPELVEQWDGFDAQAAIQDASIGTAKIADASITDAKIDSLDANKIKTGQLTADRIDATDLVAQHININSQTTGARLVMTDNVIKVYDENGVLRVRIGNLAA